MKRVILTLRLTLLLAVVALALPHTPTLGQEDDDGDKRPGSSLETCGPGVEFLGFSEALNKTTFGGFNIVELSGLTYDQHRKVYYAVADRAGPVQTHFFTVDVPVGNESIGTPTVLDVTVLKDSSGVPYNGLSFDGEGVAITHNKQLFAASEGGSGGALGPQQPEIRRFSLEGDELESLPVPPRFLIGTNNLSFESLALSPNGRSLFTANERPLPAVVPSAADGQTANFRNRIRILRYEDRGEDGFVPAEQFFYLTEPDRTPGDVGVVDLVALSETDLLVLERGFKAGAGNTVRVFRVSVEGAADVSDQPTLSAVGLVPLPKTLLFDLEDCPDDGAAIPPGATQPNALLDNFEAMALGPYLPGGRRALLLLSDDNEGANQTTRLIALAIPVASLVGQGGSPR